MASPEINTESVATGQRQPLPVLLPLAAKEKPAAPPWWWGILRSEWHAHSRLLLVFIGTWLATVWILPQFANPGWIVLFGLIFALVAGPALGGHDVLEGSEEYTFSLAITRGQWFGLRWAFGATLLTLFTLMNLVMLGLDLPQAITRFFLDLGLLDPQGALKHRFLPSLVWAFPLACYSLGFSLCANARSRGEVLASWIWAGLGALGILRLGLLWEYWEWHAWTGQMAFPALLAAAFGATVLGLRIYRTKEVVAPSKPWNVPAYWWAWALIFLGALGTISFLVISLGRELAKILGK